MRSLAAIIALLFAFSLVPQAHAEQVNATSLNCREEPQASSSIVARLPRDQSVDVVGTSGAWSKLQVQDCWVLSRYLGAAAAYSSNPSYSVYESYSTSAPQSLSRPQMSFPQLSAPSKKRFGAGRSKRSSSSSSRRAKASSSRAYGGGGSCPCSGSQVCVGPRGGRYCITSGGNKRYGV